MKPIGQILILLGFLATSWAAVQHEREVGWPLYLGLWAIAVVGVVMARAASRSEARAGDKLSGDMRNISQSIESIVRKITEMDESKGELNPYDAHGRIDELFPDDLSKFVEARQSIAHVHGLQAYADVMNDFAAGERYLNRVWSASVDGYVNEVREYLHRARQQFTDAKTKLEALGS